MMRKPQLAAANLHGCRISSAVIPVIIDDDGTFTTLRLVKIRVDAVLAT